MTSCGSVLCSRPPFRDDQDEFLHHKILTENIAFPSHFREPSRDLISRLLDRNPQSRIAGEDVLLHPFFSGWLKSVPDMPPRYYCLSPPTSISIPSYNCSRSGSVCPIDQLTTQQDVLVKHSRVAVLVMSPLDSDLDSEGSAGVDGAEAMFENF